MLKRAGPIRKDEGNHGGQKARPPPGSAQGSGALVLEEPPYSSWDTAPEYLAPSGHSIGRRHGHRTMTLPTPARGRRVTWFREDVPEVIFHHYGFE